MCQLIETIKLKDGYLLRIDYHSERLNRSRRDLFKKKNKIDLLREIIIPDDFKNGIYKCRVTYSENVENVEFEPYELKPICSLKIVHANDIDYRYKYKNRNSLKELFEQRDKADDIIIVKKSLVTDSFYCNLVFFDEKDFYTPAKPLLKGTQRKFLLDKGIIKLKNISYKDIYSFSRIFLINSMIEFRTLNVPICNII